MSESRAAPGAEPERSGGVVFPIEAGRRSTTSTGRAVFADAARAVDPALASAIEAERDWRGRYHEHARRLLEARLRHPDGSSSAARAGLESLHRRFVFERDGGSASLADALVQPRTPGFATTTVEGEGKGQRELVVPYRGERLRGDALHRQLDRWVAAGTVEPSFAEAIRLVMSNADWLEASDLRVVVLGAGAEMGPLHSLSQWGATVAPIDLPHPDVWRRILDAVRQGRGRAEVPVPVTFDGGDDPEAVAAAAGADLIRDLPEVAAWIARLEGALTLGNYVYADGATHVRVSMAVDALTVHLAGRRGDLTLAVLATPTDVFAVPEDAVEMANRRYADRQVRGPLRRAMRGLTGGRLFAANYDGVITTPAGIRLGVADCLVPQQGPNYALAKRLQRWRASIARDDGIPVSIHVAPPTRTRSVMKNRVLGAAYGGARRFGIEVFAPSTSNTLMAALLVHDLRHPQAVANPATPLAHPLLLFAEAANHGGLWRNAFAPRSVLGLAVALGMVQRGA